MKIMIVDDHADMRRMIRNIVSASGIGIDFEILECTSGEEAVRQYQNEQPNCVLMDIELITMTGFEAAQQIYKKDSEARIVFVTSHDSASFRDKAAQLGGDGFVSKLNLTDINPILQSLIV